MKFLHNKDGSYIRGTDTIFPTIRRTDAIRLLQGDASNSGTSYQSYWGINLRSGLRELMSCDPANRDSYFTNTGKPLDMSPIFFRAEVLSKYRSDPDKYRLDERSVTCRGSWSLETFDINEDDQLHTYLVYISRLPEHEQLYWKSFNIQDFTTISSRAYLNDFEGSWSEEDNPAIRLRNTLEKLLRDNNDWWTLRGSNTTEKIGYVYTRSRREWEDQILTLDQIVNEGLDEKKLKAIADGQNIAYASKYRSIKMLQLVLGKLLGSGERSEELVQPLRDLAHLRNKVRGHSPGEEAEHLYQSALLDYGTTRKHYRDLLTKIANAIGEAADLIAPVYQPKHPNLRGLIGAMDSLVLPPDRDL